MSVVSIDLRTKIVRPGTKVWRVFPGQGYAFLDTFLEDSKVFLDLPGAVLPSGVINAETPYLRDVVKRAFTFLDYYQARSEFLRSGEGSAPSRPTNDLSYYSDRTTHKRAGKGISALILMFGEARSGDLIVMPEEPYKRMIRLGEFVDEPKDRQTISLERFYPGSRVSARSVRWLAQVDEHKIPRSLSDSLRHQVAISELATDYILDVLDLAYGAYVFGNNTHHPSV